MIDIDQIYAIVEESSHESAFNREEVEALFNTLLKLSDSATVVEIGVQYGRSTSVIAEIGKVKKFNFYAIDNWNEDVSSEAREHVLRQKERHNWNFQLIDGDSVYSASDFKGTVDLIHIDGNHEYEAVLADIKAWLPKMNKNGFACFDDYGHDSLPGVYQACTEYFENNPSWKFIGRYGNKFGIYQKISD